MSDAFYLFATLLALGSALAAISIWSPRILGIKISALVIAALFLPAAYVSLIELLSRPKPIALEWKHSDLSEAVVLGANLNEGKGIYLWLKVAGVDEPRSYVLPWDQKLAQQLYDAERQAESQGTRVRMDRPFQSSYDNRRRLFYAMPQPPRPPKDIPTESPFRFQP